MDVVKQFLCVLKFASEDLNIDRGVVMAAVKQNGEALEFSS